VTPHPVFEKDDHCRMTATYCPLKFTRHQILLADRRALVTQPPCSWVRLELIVPDSYYEED